MKTRTYEFKNNDVCRNCKGEGVVNIPGTYNNYDSKCEICNGTGMVTIEKTLTVKIYPKAQ